MMQTKSTVDQIRDRFDKDVERFSNLQTGQSATMDAPLMLELVAESAAAVTPEAKAILDIGCGAGNYTLRVLQVLPHMDCTLVDLSEPMLNRAQQRVSQATDGRVVTMQGDMRELDLGEQKYDVIVAATTLHHLREKPEWEAMFTRFFAALRPGGSLWITDFITHDLPGVEKLMWRQFGDYLVNFQGEAYRDKVFAYIEEEDSPRSLEYQLRLLERVGFGQVSVLHKRACFAAFGAMRC